MRWFKRGLWLLAWGVWAALSVGLYRELPRDLGPEICNVQSPTQTYWVVGFVGASNDIAVIAKSEDPEATSINIVGAETGRVIRSTLGPRMEKYCGYSSGLARRGCLCATTLPHGVGADIERGLFLLDLRTMKWRTISSRSTVHVTIHPTRPWIVFVEQTDQTKPGGAVVLVDFEAGKETVVCTLPEDHSLDNRPFFIGASDRLVVASFRTGPSDGVNDRRRMEIWKLLPTPAFEKRLKQVPSGAFINCVDDGRLAIYHPTDLTKVEVFDLLGERMLFTGSSRPYADQPKEPRGVRSALSSSGRSILGGDPPLLWAVDDGRILWRPRPHERSLMSIADEDFEVLERWGSLWQGWLPSVKYSTYAFRSHESGDLLFRLNGKARIEPYFWNAPKTLAISIGGGVYRFPAQVNWPLLALCQTVLATPMVLLWAVLRWRKGGWASGAASARRAVAESSRD